MFSKLNLLYSVLYYFILFHFLKASSWPTKLISWLKNVLQCTAWKHFLIVYTILTNHRYSVNVKFSHTIFPPLFCLPLSHQVKLHTVAEWPRYLKPLSFYWPNDIMLIIFSWTVEFTKKSGVLRDIEYKWKQYWRRNSKMKRIRYDLSLRKTKILFLK